jgi:hypothetical protein
MISQRRGAQIGLAAAALLLISCFGILAIQGDNTSSIAKDLSVAGQQNQTSALPIAVSLSARARSPQQ